MSWAHTQSPSLSPPSMFTDGRAGPSTPYHSEESDPVSCSATEEVVMYKRQFFWLIGGFRRSKVSGSVQLEAWPQGSVTHPYQRRKNIYDLEKGVKKLLNNPSPQVYAFCVGSWEQSRTGDNSRAPKCKKVHLSLFFFSSPDPNLLDVSLSNMTKVHLYFNLKGPAWGKINSPMFSDNNIYV